MICCTPDHLKAKTVRRRYDAYFADQTAPAHHFGKFGALKYTSNLDVAKIWERVLPGGCPSSTHRDSTPVHVFNWRRCGGISSECEIIDVALREVMPTWTV
jgi:hypothetical protein